MHNAMAVRLRIKIKALMTLSSLSSSITGGLSALGLNPKEEGWR
jgi:hypothetical protein